jgi:hypothetical protein
VKLEAVGCDDDGGAMLVREERSGRKHQGQDEEQSEREHGVS